MNRNGRLRLLAVAALTAVALFPPSPGPASAQPGNPPPPPAPLPPPPPTPPATGTVLSLTITTGVINSTGQQGFPVNSVQPIVNQLLVKVDVTFAGTPPATPTVVTLATSNRQALVLPPSVTI